MFKRGIVGTQFNWIFTLVTGVVFLSLLFGFGMKYVELQKEKQAYEIAFGVDAVISGLVGVETVKSFSSTVDFDFGFYCDSLWVNGLARKDLRNNVVFGGRDITSDSLLFFTKSFERPFKVRDIIYVADLDKKICFVGDGDGLKEQLPESVNLVNSNCDLTVYFSAGSVRDDEMRIYGDTVMFSDGKTSDVYGSDELKIGAIVAENKLNYDCALDELNSTYSVVKDIYLYRASSGCHSTLNSYLNSATFINPLEAEIISANSNLLSFSGCEVVF